MASQDQIAQHGLAGAAPPPGVRAQLRRGVFGLIALVILLGPAPGQLFGLHSPALREWVMYSGVGVGLLRGRFVIEEAGREIAAMTPLQALDLKRYPKVKHYFFEHRVFAPADLAGYAAGLCAAAGPGQTVAYLGEVGTRQGWRPMAVADVCAATLPEAGQ